MNCVKDLNLM